MPLPYATVKPHDPAICSACSPARPGHCVCMNSACPGRGENGGAGRLATMNARRHATDDEFAALPLGLRPIDGIAHQAVYACDECGEDTCEPFCADAHTPPEPAPCPVCSASGTDPCLKRDGVTNRPGPHAERPAPHYTVCTHAHRPDCPVFDGCTCSSADPPPERPKHPAAGGHHPAVSHLLISEPAAQMLLMEHGIHWWQVREAASVWTQDTKPALRAEYATLDDAGHPAFDVHGHEVRAEIVIEITAPPQT